MVEVRLHGPLAAEFGQRWDLDIRSPAEAVAAIECGRPGFRAAIMRLSNANMVFRVRSQKHDYDENDITMNLGSVKRIDFIPIVSGASAGVRFVIGAVLVVAGIMVSATGAVPVGNFMIATGVSLMFGAVTEWLTPVQKKGDDAYKNTRSWTIGGPTNTADQGNPVPIIYGEVMTGGYTISAGIQVGQLSSSGVVGPSVVISGLDEHSLGTHASGDNFTARYRYTCELYNAVNPTSFVWTVSGFAGATVTLEQVGERTVVLVLAFDIFTLGQSIFPYTGTLSVTVVATDSASSTGIAPQSVTMNATKNSTVYLNTIDYRYNAGT